MKYLYSWIKDYYPEAPAIDRLEALLIQLGHDVEKIEPVILTGVVVAKVVSLDPHPSVKRLSLVKVTTGSDVIIVSSDSTNISIGQKVALAKNGSHLPSGMAIRTTIIGGHESAGVLCTAGELGLADKHTGILVLDDSAKIGESVSAYLPTDAVITLDITSDRGDVLSHLGLARDIKAGHEGTLLHYLLKPLDRPNQSSLAFDTVHSDCRWLGFARATLSSKPKTPALVESRLNLLGQRPINPASDLTNYIMLAFGQPAHAYDRFKLSGLTFGVRRAHDGEKFSGINQRDYRLTAQNLVITNNDTPIALAGVIGSFATRSEVKTSEVVFEVATFSPKAVSFSARGLNLLTDAALRFERGTNEEVTETIFYHLLATWCDWTGARVDEITIYKLPPTPTVPLKISVIDLINFIGTPLPIQKIQLLLTAVGCTIEVETETEWNITPPAWRHDLTILEDYAEELVRLVGCHNLDKSPLSPSVPLWKRSHFWRNEYAKDTLVSLGFSEIQTYPFTGHAEAQLMGYQADSLLELEKEPIKDKKYLRPSLAFGMLTTLGQNPETANLALFELGHVYATDRETEQICIAVAGSNSVGVDSAWQNLFERFRLPVSSWMSRVRPVEKRVLDGFKIRKPIVTLLEMAIDEFEPIKSREILPVVIPDLDAFEVKMLSRFQLSTRDIAFVVDTSYDENELEAQLRQVSPSIVDVELFDRYANPEKIGPGKQSFAFHITYQSGEKTLTTTEIDYFHRQVEMYVKEKLHGVIR